MAKILLVEDDNNLREIYEARLQAEGYDIASAKDGEEALVKAKQEKPDLIISDVMMPRISGFEMLDILRNTEGLKEAKVIMLTALGQAEDKTRADSLGADRYLVKSQVTLEDIVKAADELLNGNTATPSQTPAAAPVTPATPVAMPMATPPPAAPAGPVTPAPEPVNTTAAPQAAPATNPAEPATPAATPVAAPAIPVAQPPADHPAAAPVISMPTTPASTPPAGPEPAPSAAPAVATPAPQTPATPPAVTPDVAAPAPSPATPPATGATPAAPVTPAAPITTPAEPVAPATPADKAPTPAPQPEATPTTPAEAPAAADDKLIADAVKNLSDALSAPEPTDSKPADERATPKPAEVPATSETSPAPAPESDKPAEPVVPSITTPADHPAPAPASSIETPTAPPVPDTPNDTAAVPSTLPPEPAAPTAPTTPEPVDTTAAPVEPVEAPAAPTPQADEEKPEAAPAQPVAPPAPVDGVATAADEQAVMQAQIEDFIKQQGTAESTPPAPEQASTVVTPGDSTTPAVPQTTSDQPDMTEQEALDQLPDLSEQPTGTVVTSDAPLLGATPAGHPAAPNPIIAPEQTTPPAPAAPSDDEETADVDDPVSIAHKKVIQPPVEPIQTQPDLSELLAKEGISSLDEEHEEPIPTNSNVPHQPGHVISPNGATGPAPLNPNDPNNIAL